jgi:hypothetical protein
MKKTLLILFALILNGSYAQTQEQLFEFSYLMAKEFGKGPKLEVKSVTYKPNNIYKKLTYKKEELTKFANYFVENSIVKAEKGNNKYDILLESKFPLALRDSIFGKVNLKNIGSELFNSKNKKVELKKSNSNSFGGKFKENSNTELEYQSIVNKSAVEVKGNTDVKGSITYELSFLTDYTILKLDKTKIGSVIELNKLKYELVNVISNKVVLKKMYDSYNETNIKLLIFDKNNKLVVLDESDTVPSSSQFARGEYDKKYYEFIDTHKNFTLEEFKKDLSFEDIQNKKPDYVVLEGITTIENDFILYEPMYEKKEFKVSLK